MSVTDADGVVETYGYDALKRLVKITRAGDATTYEYGTEADGLYGLLKAMNYPTYREEYRYDHRDRIVQTIQILAQPGTQTEATERIIAQQEYDARGQITSTTDNQGRITQSTYDKLGRVVAITDPLNGVVQYSYDKQDNLLTVTDAKGSTTTYAYNKLGKKIKETRPMGEVTRYSYNALGILSVRTDALGNETRYGYEELQTTQAYFTFANGVLSPSPSQSIIYQFNAQGQFIGYQQTGDTESKAVYEYDADGNRTSETVTYGSGASQFSKTLRQSYTLAGRKRSQTYPDGSEVTYTYNANGQLESATLPDGQIRWESYQWQQPTKIVLPSVVRIQEYDPLQRPIRLKSQQIGTGTAENPTGDIIMDYRYQYDRAGNIRQRQTEEGVWQYAYDALDRLTQAIPPEALQQSASNPNGLPVESYTYDAVRNRMTSAHQPGMWNYNQNNQLLSFGTEENKTIYAYNRLGHAAQETTIQNSVTTRQRNFIYNAAERLTEVKENNLTIAQYQYDPFGRRISKTVNGETIWFQYGDEGLIAEYSGSTPTKLYGWQPQGLWGSEPLWQTRINGSQKTTHYHHADNLGTSQRLTDKDGEQVWTMLSEAFGKATVPATATTENNLRFPGQYYDSETGLHYNWNRDYDPVSGRYVQTDPIGLEGGINIFAYAANNPVIFIDPEGKVVWIPAAIGAVCGAVAGGIRGGWRGAAQGAVGGAIGGLGGVGGGLMGAVGRGAGWGAAGGAISGFDPCKPVSSTAGGTAGGAASGAGGGFAGNHLGLGRALDGVRNRGQSARQALERF